MEHRIQTVLVVDDDSELRQLLATILREEGFWVQTAGDGLEALALATHEMPDLILLDLRMPVMDGLTFAEHLHMHSRKPAPIIMMSASEDPLGWTGPCRSVLRLDKPFDLSSLLEAIARYLPAAPPGP